MDITLERVLSLIPKKPDGKYIHGAKKEFAESLGYDGGDIISMWIKGTSTSYEGKLHEIASKYGVTVEWLKGETDEKTPPAPAMSAVKQEAYKLIESMSDEQLEKFIRMARIMLGEK